QQADLAQVARTRTAPGAATSTLRVRPVGAVAERLVASRAPGSAGPWEATLETVALDELLGADDGAPWMKEGWFHAYRLLAPPVPPPRRRRPRPAPGRRGPRAAAHDRRPPRPPRAPDPRAGARAPPPRGLRAGGGRLPPPPRGVLHGVLGRGRERGRRLP